MTWIFDPIVALVILLAIALILAVVSLTMRSRLRPLSAEARHRFVVGWNRIEARFLDSPANAVRDADSLIISLLRERGHSLEPNRLPAEVHQARREAATPRAEGPTEALRQAMLHYRRVVELMVGSKELRHKVRAGRPEVA